MTTWLAHIHVYEDGDIDAFDTVEADTAAEAEQETKENYPGSTITIRESPDAATAKRWLAKNEEL